MQQIIYQRLSEGCFGPRSIEIYGGAYHIAGRDYTLKDVVHGISNAMHNAEFFAPEVPPIEVFNNFCHLMLVDPALVKAYLG